VAAGPHGGAGKVMQVLRPVQDWRGFTARDPWIACIGQTTVVNSGFHERCGLLDCCLLNDVSLVLAAISGPAPKRTRPSLVHLHATRCCYPLRGRCA